MFGAHKNLEQFELSLLKIFNSILKAPGERSVLFESESIAKRGIIYNFIFSNSC